MSKTYTIRSKRIKGRIYSNVKFVRDSVTLLNITWNPDDKEEESKALRSADMTVIRHGLKYKTRKLKPVKK